MTARPLEGLRILLVEDEAIVAFDLCDLLTDFGAECVGPALTIDEALHLIDREFLDSAILDVRVGRSSVYPAAERLSAKGVPWIFHTGDADLGMLGRDWPGCAAIQKPADTKTLIAALAAITRPN